MNNTAKYIYVKCMLLSAGKMSRVRMRPVQKFSAALKQKTCDRKWRARNSLMRQNREKRSYCASNRERERAGAN
uniref:Uncharacterized protein n=1 Tax=Oryza brachyantha TaxID=4533 RepID=J3LWF5_ORYBR